MLAQVAHELYCRVICESCIVVHMGSFGTDNLESDLKPQMLHLAAI